MTAPANLDAAGLSTDAALDSNIIILEFELERDLFNPLYPPVADDSSSASGVSSPSTDTSSNGVASAESGGSTSDSSGRTLVSTDSDGNLMTNVSSTEGSTPSLLTSESPSGQNGSGNGSSMPASSTTAHSDSPSPSVNRGSPRSEVVVSSEQSRPRAGGTSSALATPDSEDEWMPSPEDILESTTSRAKPLLALERLRRSRRTTIEGPASPASSFASPGPGTRARRSLRARRGGGAVGMMDVFAVMAQINEQLGAAPDLEAFLKVVVGVIKDLTQFHRVLVYQFDEAWNGKVKAELVDWNQTHDLYQGLHFPAADIPAQARSLYAISKSNCISA